MTTTTTTPLTTARSERGIALVVVLLLMSVLSGLAMGFSLNGQVESTMAKNEVFYAGARAAAEAGINRATAAIRLENDVNLLAGQDGLVDADNPAAAVNADNGDVEFLLTGAAPYALSADGQYTYQIEIFDDDDPALYNGTILTPEQLTAMGLLGVPEDGVAVNDVNRRLILRATGFGPSNTVVTVSRMLLTTIIPIPGATINPAILVDGDVSVDGNLNLTGDEANIHANGDLTINGNSATVEGDATASGELIVTSNNFEADGTMGGGYPNINVPEVTAEQFLDIADYILHDDGSKTLGDGTTACGAACNVWSWSAGTGTWSITGNSGSAGTFYVEGKVSISGSPSGPGNSPIRTTLIATGSVSITGSPKFAPDNDNNPQSIQIVTNGDLHIGGSGDLVDPTIGEGQIFVKEQIHTQGNFDFNGRIIVQDDSNLFDDVTSNSIGGTPTVDYDGTLPGYVIPPTTSFTYNVTGWIEG